MNYQPQLVSLPDFCWPSTVALNRMFSGACFKGNFSKVLEDSMLSTQLSLELLGDFFTTKIEDVIW